MKISKLSFNKIGQAKANGKAVKNGLSNGTFKHEFKVLSHDEVISNRANGYQFLTF